MQSIVLTRRGVASLFLTAALARPAMAALPPTQAELVSRVEAYFNGIQTLQASFQQLAPDGGLTTGKLYIDRTREAMRFSYDPPSKIRLVAPGDWRVIFYDGSIQQVNVIPISETPLGFILSKQVVLAGDVTVESVQERGPALDLTLYRTAAPDQGRLKLTLATDPMLLRSWAVTDAQGLTTTIALDDVQTGMPIDRELFRWRDPKMFGWPKD